MGCNRAPVLHFINGSYRSDFIVEQSHRRLFHCFDWPICGSDHGRRRFRFRIVDLGTAGVCK